MDKLILTALIICCFTTIYAQESDHLEVLPLSTGWYYRTSPEMKFEYAGVWGRKLKPYFQQNEASKRSFRQFQRSSQLMLGAGVVSYTGISLMLVGARQGNAKYLKTGIAMDVTGVIVMLIVANEVSPNMYRALDSYNYDKRPLTSLLPAVQVSSESLGIGLVWKW